MPSSLEPVGPVQTRRVPLFFFMWGLGWTPQSVQGLGWIWCEGSCFLLGGSLGWRTSSFEPLGHGGCKVWVWLEARFELEIVFLSSRHTSRNLRPILGTKRGGESKIVFSWFTAHKQTFEARFAMSGPKKKDWPKNGPFPVRVCSFFLSTRIRSPFCHLGKGMVQKRL